jgi:hypothetical protein
MAPHGANRPRLALPGHYSWLEMTPEGVIIMNSPSGMSTAKSIMHLMRKTVLTSCLALAACAPTLHPIVAQPPIPDAEAVQRLCLDYMRRAVPAGSLSEAVGVAHERQTVFDSCLAAHGWAE